MSLRGLLWAMVAGAVFGLVAMLFARSTHAIAGWAKRHVTYGPLRPVLGGLVVTGLAFGLGLSRTSRYLGLGVPTIVAAFSTRLPPYVFAGKLAFTAITLGTGFKGGEVTPLFYIGATLGNALSRLVPLPSSLLAGMGFAAVFAGAANTPIASTLLAVELFGAEAGAYAGVACVLSYLFSGKTGIYHAQRNGAGKRIGGEDPLPEALGPRDFQDLRVSAAKHGVRVGRSAVTEADDDQAVLGSRSPGTAV